MKRWKLPVIVGLALGMIVHVAIVEALPGLVMNKAISLIKANAYRTLKSMGFNAEGVGLENIALHAPPIKVEDRQVVAPSPNLLYTAIIYDVSKRPLLIEVPIPKTYWSISFFADNTDNYYVKDDRQIHNNPATFVLVGSKYNGALPSGVNVVKAESDTGLILFRSLIKNKDQLKDLITTREKTIVHPL